MLAIPLCPSRGHSLMVLQRYLLRALLVNRLSSLFLKYGVVESLRVCSLVLVNSLVLVLVLILILIVLVLVWSCRKHQQRYEALSACADVETVQRMPLNTCLKCQMYNFFWFLI